MVEIRQTTISDIDGIKTIDEYFEFHKSRHIEAISDGTHFVAVKGKELVGTVIFDYKFFGNCIIRLVQVSPQHQRQGIGTQLIKFVEQKCLYDKVFISTQGSNLSMIALLKKLEYQPSGHVKFVNEDIDDDELFFCKNVK